MKREIGFNLFFYDKIRKIRCFPRVYVSARASIICSAILNFSCIFRRFTIIFLYLSKIDKFAPGNPLRFFIQRVQRQERTISFFLNIFRIFNATFQSFLELL